MGQGQEIIARKYMASATVEGQWVLLQNTHLGLGYLTEVSLHCPFSAGSCSILYSMS
jgi:dynein heavy chain